MTAATRTEIARILRKAGMKASGSVGRGFTGGYDSWLFDGVREVYAALLDGKGWVDGE